jgi:hypothetical protein
MTNSFKYTTKCYPLTRVYCPYTISDRTLRFPEIVRPFPSVGGERHSDGLMPFIGSEVTTAEGEKK